MLLAEQPTLLPDFENRLQAVSGLFTRNTLSHRRACKPTVDLHGSRSVCPHLFRAAKMAKTVLVADDSPIIRTALCRLFEDEDDYDICAEAKNGEEAIDLAKKCRPNLIILDMSMPVMNGLEAAQELKKIMPDVPIILFTQYENMGRAIFCLDHTVDRIVSKDEPEVLMEQVRSLAPA
jgi:CheY-like chemotaxis protein